LKIKKVRKCKNKKNKYLITLRVSKRAKEIEAKIKKKDVAITAALKGENFLEEEYSNHSDSYIELEQF
jgi:hypothetical protein